jgi:hypothetical protein
MPLATACGDMGDDQGGIAVLGQQTGCAAAFTVVKRLHLCCHARGVDLGVEGRLRTGAQVAYADSLSRSVDRPAGVSCWEHLQVHMSSCEGAPQPVLVCRHTDGLVSRGGPRRPRAGRREAAARAAHCAAQQLLRGIRAG